MAGTHAYARVFVGVAPSFLGAASSSPATAAAALSQATSAATAAAGAGAGGAGLTVMQMGTKGWLSKLQQDQASQRQRLDTIARELAPLCDELQHLEEAERSVRVEEDEAGEPVAARLHAARAQWEEQERVLDET